LWLTIVIRFSLPARALAQAPRGTMIFGMVAVALGENLRLHMVAYPPNPCIARLGFVDANGIPLQVNKSVNLNGQTALLDFNANTALNQFGQSLELRPVMTLAQDVGPSAPPPSGFGVGIASGQVLRLNVVAYPPTACNAQLGLDNTSSVPRSDAGKTVNLNPGQAAFLDVSAAALRVGFSQRVELQPVVIVTSNPSAAPSACLANAEVFDSFSGRTSA
jgi:hypothetical protein